jgi:hypothetical protein
MAITSHGPKMMTWFTSENPLLIVTMYAFTVLQTRFIVGKGLSNDEFSKLSDGEKKNVCVVEKLDGGLPACPVNPYLNTSSGKNPEYIFEGKTKIPNSRTAARAYIVWKATPRPRIVGCEVSVGHCHNSGWTSCC